MIISRREILKAIEKIPPFSPAVTRTLRVLRDPTSTARDVAQELAKDSVLTAEILKLVNSPLFGLSRKVISLEHAVVLLGFRTTEKIVMTVGVKRNLDVELENYKLLRGELSVQGFVGGMVARKIASEIAPELEDLVFTAGVLRVLGKIAMNWVIGLRKVEYMERIRKVQDLEALEKKLFGISSYDLTVKAVEKLGVGEDVVEVLRYIAKPSSYKGESEAIAKASAIVHIADKVTQMTGLGAGIDNLKSFVDEGVFRILGITEREIADWTESAVDIYKSLEEEGFF